MKSDSMEEILLKFHEVSQEVTRIFKSKNTTIHAFLISKFLFEKDKLSIKKLGELLKLSISSTTQILNRMEKQKLITRKENNIDRRLVYVSLTTKGKMKYKSDKIDIVSDLQKIDFLSLPD